ncbi:MULTISPECIES: phage tail protein [Streptomyces]|jgi:phage tail-like protein|uniref:Phage tail protein n=3 Tax=Streptomyces TaxID=1883 RepID=A0ABV3B018_9ACTN|nr:MULTISPECIES: phage tail protein [Streptomyces]MCL6738787.1 phage tail protein [Streptomyces neyagawaensis]MDC2949054.1 phage tail protein [Streptomyces heilongjiangensis]MDE1688547.1 phage tail protein [Streptomyces neyagawaensis]MDG5809279.1 phage tail protein [Streptomyces ossamyceticus]PIM66551.1 phage tail protein [Streptomyces sp. JV178]
MSLMQADSLTSHNFGLQIDGVMVEYLAEVSGLSLEQDVITYQQNSAQGRPEVNLLPGVQRSGQCTVVRGMTQSASFTQWINDSIAGQMSSARKNASIIMMDFQNNPVKRYNMRNAWCSKVDASTLKAGEASALTETVTIVFEELVIE